MLKAPHFFKAKSRLGLLYPPIRHKQMNIGIEDAPDFILNQQFLTEFAKYKISEFSFSEPEKLKAKDYYKILAKELNEFKNLINRDIKMGETQVVIGGDNSVTLSSLLAAIERFSDTKDIGYIQFDSHGEMHLYKSSISKNFHGMYMRPFLDKFDIPEIEKLVPKKLDLNQVLAIGDIVFDEGDESDRGERKLYEGIRNITQDEFRSQNEKVREELEKFMNRFKHIHLNFDIDVFDASVAGPSGMGDEGVWLWEDVTSLLEIIKKSSSISIDLVEVNPLKKGSKKTIRVAQEVLLTILKD